MKFHWEVVDLTRLGRTVKAMDLFVGELPNPMATLRLRKKMWEITFWVPMPIAHRQYDTLEAQKEQAEATVVKWFRLALHGAKDKGCTYPDCACAISFPEGYKPSEATECPRCVA